MRLMCGIQKDTMEKRLAKERNTLLQENSVCLTEEIPTPRTTDHWMRWRLESVGNQITPTIPATIILTFPKNYPFVSPLVQILNASSECLERLTCCHSKDGHLCMSDFLPEWNPSLQVSYILQKIRSHIKGTE